MDRRIAWTAVFCLLCLGGCRSSANDSEGNDPLLRAGDFYLYRSEVESALPAGVHGADSVRFVERYMRAWAEDMLLYQQAEENLPESEEITRRVEAYRRALVMHAYQERLVEQELIADVTYEEVEAYYETHCKEFVATEPYLKGVFLKIPLRASFPKMLRGWLKNPAGDNLDRLEKYCLSHAVNYDCFPEKWRAVSEMSSRMPLVEKGADYFRRHKNMEVTDSVFRYFLYVSEVMSSGDCLPLEHAAGEIKEILVNLKRAGYISRMKSDFYRQALEDKEIIYY